MKEGDVASKKGLFSTKHHTNDNHRYVIFTSIELTDEPIYTSVLDPATIRYLRLRSLHALDSQQSIHSDVRRPGSEM